MMASNNQKLKITNEYGLQMYGLNNNTPAVTFGKNDQFGYGMFFTNGNGQITLQARDDGYLHVIDKIYAGEGAATAGISGGDIKFWAGTDQPSESSPFRVDKDGNVYAKKFNTGDSTTLSALSREEDITTIGATAIMADAFMYAPDLETDFLTAEEIVSGDITIQNGALIFQKGSTKAILYFNGEKLVVEYE